MLLCPSLQSEAFRSTFVVHVILVIYISQFYKAKSRSAELETDIFRIYHNTRMARSAKFPPMVTAKQEYTWKRRGRKKVDTTFLINRGMDPSSTTHWQIQKGINWLLSNEIYCRGNQSHMKSHVNVLIKTPSSCCESSSVWRQDQMEFILLHSQLFLGSG